MDWLIKELGFDVHQVTKVRVIVAKNAHDSFSYSTDTVHLNSCVYIFL